MGKLPDDEQKSHTRPTGWDERAPSFAKASAAKQHREIPSFSPGGKWGVWAVEVSMLTYGDLIDLRSRFRGSAPVSNGGCDR